MNPVKAEFIARNSKFNHDKLVEHGKLIKDLESSGLENSPAVQELQNEGDWHTDTINRLEDSYALEYDEATIVKNMDAEEVNDRIKVWQKKYRKPGQDLISF